MTCRKQKQQFLTYLGERITHLVPCEILPPTYALMQYICITYLRVCRQCIREYTVYVYALRCIFKCKLHSNATTTIIAAQWFIYIIFYFLFYFFYFFSPSIPCSINFLLHTFYRRNWRTCCNCNVCNERATVAPM